MSKLISDEDYHTFFRIVGELAATKGVLAQMENELKYQRELTKYAIELRAAPNQEQPASAQQTQAGSPAGSPKPCALCKWSGSTIGVGGDISPCYSCVYSPASESQFEERTASAC